MSENILSRIVSPGQLVDQQGAKLLIYGASGAVKQLLVRQHLVKL
jgi:hypothetical protein